MAKMVKTATRDYYLPMTAGFIVKFFNSIPDEATVDIGDEIDQYGDRVWVFKAEWED